MSHKPPKSSLTEPSFCNFSKDDCTFHCDAPSSDAKISSVAGPFSLSRAAIRSGRSSDSESMASDSTRTGQEITFMASRAFSRFFSALRAETNNHLIFRYGRSHNRGPTFLRLTVLVQGFPNRMADSCDIVRTASHFPHELAGN